LGASSLYLSRTLRVFREAALKNQLADLRMSLKTYEMVYGAPPADIRILLNEEMNLIPYSSQVIKKKYVESVRSDKEGFPLDPFGNRFVYRSDVGKIKSGTKGYEEL
jgi:hypothetical protein